MIKGSLGEIYAEKEMFADERGLLTKIVTPSTFSDGEIVYAPKEIFYSRSRIGVVRGIHNPISENEFWRAFTVTSGKAYDVLIDLRKESATFGQVVTNILEENSHVILLPYGVGHGFQAIENETSILYLFGEMYANTVEKGINPINPIFKWPLEITQVSLKDLNLPDLVA